MPDEQQIYRKRFFGVYRGIVVDNDDSKDPDFPYCGRVKIKVPSVHGNVDDEDLLPWAWSTTSLAGAPVELEEYNSKGEKEKSQVGWGVVCIPPIDAVVFVMFEEGDPMIPVILGSWYPVATGVPEQARQIQLKHESAPETKYPDAYLFKSPYRKDVYVRFNGDHSLEVTFGDDTVLMKGPSLDNEKKDDGEVSVKTKKSNITLEVVGAFQPDENDPNSDMDTDKGKITLKANSIEIWAKKDLKIYCGEWEENTETGQTDVVTDGDITLYSSRNMNVFCTKEGRQGAADRDEGSWQMAAKTTSGYEKHP